MMKLTKIRLINWYHFENATIEVDNSTLLVGDNGCGKSTLLDAIQYVLTTEEKFNKAANEKSARNLDGYVRCKLGTEGQNYKRNDGRIIGYIALEFLNGNKSPLVVGVRMDAQNEGSVKSSWFVKKDTILDEIAFLESNKPSYTLKDIFDKNIVFEANKTAAREKIKFSLGKITDKFFELIHKALAFRPVDKVSEFINKFLLQENKIDVGGLKKAIDSLKQMEETVKRVGEQITVLKEIVDVNGYYEESIHKKEINEIISHILQIKLTNLESERAISKLNEHKILIESYKNDSKKFRELSDKFTEQIVVLDNDRQLVALQKEKEILGRMEIEVDKCKKLKRSFDEQIIILQKAVNKLNMNFKVNEGLINSSSSQDKLIFIKNVLEKIEKKIDDLANKKSDFAYNKKELQSKIVGNNEKLQKLKNKQFEFPSPSVEKLRKAILDDFQVRGIDEKVYVFCELLDIQNVAWTNAIEGYLDKQRFNLIINPKHYKIASSAYDRLDKKEVYGTGIVNLEKLEKKDLHEHSLAKCVTAQNDFASKYLDHLLGDVVMCSAVAELSQYKKSITAECMKYTGCVLSRINFRTYETPFIGKTAIERQIESLKAENIFLSNQIKELDEKLHEIDAILDLNKTIRTEFVSDNSDIELRLSESIKSVKSKKDYIVTLESESNFADKIEARDKFEKEKNLALQREREAQDNAEKNIKLSTSVENEITQFNQQISECNNFVEQIKTNKYDSYILALYQIEQCGDTKTAILSKKTEADRYLREVSSLLARLQNELENKQKNYANKYECDHKIGVSTVQLFLNDYYKLVQYDIVEKENKLEKVRAECERHFRNDFIHRMHGSIEAAESQFKKLNEILKNISYGDEKYRFKIEPRVDRKRLYEMISSGENQGGDTLSWSYFEEQYRDEINFLFDQIKTEEDGNKKVYDDYSDYRNYLQYDIEITNNNGKQHFSKICLEKSGGETQTPFYVIIAAAFYQIYGEDTVRLIMLDEAFDKMDDIRIKSMLEFFKTLKFQIILATPPAKMDVISRYVETVLIVKKIDNNGIVFNVKNHINNGDV